MTLRKKTVNKSVRYIPKTEQTKERESKPKRTKAGSLLRKQIKKLSQNNEKWVASGFGIFERKMNCYYQLKNIQILRFNEQK